MIGLAALLLAAATSADPGPLERCDPPPGWDVVAARGTRYVVFGEQHGTEQAPAFVGDVACALAFQGERLLIAIELDAGTNAALHRAWSEPDDLFQAALRRVWPAGRDDGVGSEAMMALLLRLHSLRVGGRSIDIVAFNGDAVQERSGPFSSLPGQGPHEATQAANIRAADGGHYDHVLVLTGNLHARKQPVSRGGMTFKPMAMRLAPAGSVTSLDMVNGAGTVWNCQMPAGLIPAPSLPIRSDVIECGVHPTSGSPLAAPGPSIALTAPPGRPADPAYDGYFWVGRVTASPPAVPGPSPR